MSRAAKWKVEKAKVKVVFRLQFHATHIPASGWDKLFISFVPADSGKATAKTSKASVRNGSCKWADPIYESTRLLLDSKSKQYDDKLYKLVVGMGTSRSGILGEATINLADYADASKPLALALPLHGSDHGTVLHVTVQLLTAKTGFREFEQQRDRGLQSSREIEPSTAARSSSSEPPTTDDHVNKVNARTQVKPESKELPLEETGVHEEFSDSQPGYDGSSNASEAHSAADNVNNRVSGDFNGPPKHQTPPAENDVADIYEENLRLRGSLETAESTISELRSEITTLQSHVNEMGTETEKFARELAGEIGSSRELANEVTALKSECSKLKNGLERLTESKPGPDRKTCREPVSIGSIEAEIERENLVRKMEEMECYYEALVQELEENQKRIVAEFQSLQNEHAACKAEAESARRDLSDRISRFADERRDLGNVNAELERRVTASESALKRARLNYSIAVTQLQKDLDMLSVQVSSMFETNQNVIREAFSDAASRDSPEDRRSKQHSGGDALSDDLKKSLSFQENLYKKVEQMSSVNLYFDVYSGTLEETLLEAGADIRATREKLNESVQKLELSNRSRDLLLARLQRAVDDNATLEADLERVSNENFFLSEKLAGCETLLVDYRDCKSRYEAAHAENLDLENLLETWVLDNGNLRREIFRLAEQKKDAENERDASRLRFERGIHDAVAKFDVPDGRIEKLRFRVDSVAEKVKHSLEAEERNVERSEGLLTHLASMELELQKISSLDDNFEQQIVGLSRELETSKSTVSELSRENQDLTASLRRKSEEFDTLKQRLRCVNDELGVERGLGVELADMVKGLTSELNQERERSRLFKKLASDHESENSKVLRLVSQHEESLEKLRNEHLSILSLDSQLAEMHETIVSEDLKLVFVKTQYETRIEELVKRLEFSNERHTALEKKHLDNEQRLAGFVEENEELSVTVKSLRSELEASVAQNLAVSASENVLKRELEAYEDKSESEVARFGELETKFHDTEARLKRCLENEAGYREENERLATILESIRTELAVAVAFNLEISESNVVLEHRAETLDASLTEVKSQHAIVVSQLKDMLAKSEEQVCELETKLRDTEERLNRSLEENEKLSTAGGAVRSELEASVACNAEILESNAVLERRAETLEASLTEVKSQHAVVVGQLEDVSAKSEAEVRDLERKLHETEATLKHRLENEARYVEENEKLSTAVGAVRSELEASVTRNAEISESNAVLQRRAETLEVSLTDLKSQHAVVLGRLNDTLGKSEAEVCELEMKLHETEAALNRRLGNEPPSAAIGPEPADSETVSGLKEESEIVWVVLRAKLDEQNHELLALRRRCGELSTKLSEQSLKTEEFKNLSIHLKELVDGATAAREKRRDTEGPSESLRIAFMKEQHQTTVNELRQQLAASKRHAEEMLFKLQDAIDENERLKKSEAAHARRVEELASAVSDRRDYDRIQAELECALLSLECRKEENEKLAGTLREREAEKSRIEAELSSVRDEIEKHGHVGLNGSTNNKDVRAVERVSESEGTNWIPEDPPVDYSKRLTVVNDQFKAQHLRSFMVQLDEELEKMKNESSLLPLANYDPGFQDLLRELARLHKVNEELGSIYPDFNDFRGNGNALERVLALEIELAEALRAKRKPTIQFQSSFLKQHGDEEAVFKSFRDINELIKDMLELKSKHALAETELNEMHGRYSQLSLRFAEVEGERQKLMMTLKNVRSSRNLLRRPPPEDQGQN